MKQVLNFFYAAAGAFILLSSAGCTDKNALIDQNNQVPDHNWTYLNTFGFSFKIDDDKIPYNLYVNLRVTADYKYSNIFVMITQTDPDKKTEIKRHEFKLADQDGRWLGKGSGDLYSYQLPFRSNYRFPQSGIYHIYIEQNMRDNPLRHVSDVGLRVERAGQ